MGHKNSIFKNVEILGELFQLNVNLPPLSSLLLVIVSPINK